MKISLLLLILTSFCFAQIPSALQEDIQEIEIRGGKVTLLNSKELLVEYEGLTRKFYLGRTEAGQIEPVDTTIINVLEIDTNQYNKMFSFWQKLEIFNTPLFVDDLNGNGKPEIYGSNIDANQQHGGPVRIFELYNSGKYKLLTMLSDSATLGIKAFGNIDNRGEKDLYISYLNNASGVIFISDSLNMLPIKYQGSFSYNTNSQINNMTFGDFDNNGITDCIFSTGEIVIGEYRDTIQNFAFLFNKTISWDISPFAICDFDGDGKTEFIYSNTQGIINGIKTTAVNTYENLLWEGNLGLPNAYMSCVTNDIDGNGKKEFWIGGQDLGSDTVKVVIKCFEADGNNIYKEKAIIILPFVYSLTVFQIRANDLDNDGIEELIIQIGNIILILKFDGSICNHNYYLIYIKYQETSQPGAEFYALQIADLNLDDKKDILLPMYNYNSAVQLFSYILTQNISTNIKGESSSKQKDNYLLTYPNPFNLNARITYAIPEDAKVQIKVYDILGTEVAELVNETKPSGIYETIFDASELCSGVYIYRIIALNGKRILFSQSKQMVLIK